MNPRAGAEVEVFGDLSRWGCACDRMFRKTKYCSNGGRNQYFAYLNAQKAAKHALCFTRQAKSNQQAMEQRVMEYLSSEGRRRTRLHYPILPHARSLTSGRSIKAKMCAFFAE